MKKRYILTISVCVAALSMYAVWPLARKEFPKPVPADAKLQAPKPVTPEPIPEPFPSFAAKEPVEPLPVTETPLAEPTIADQEKDHKAQLRNELQQLEKNLVALVDAFFNSDANSQSPEHQFFVNQIDQVVDEMVTIMKQLGIKNAHYPSTVHPGGWGITINPDGTYDHGG